MAKVRFIDHGGGSREVDIDEGRSLMEGARDAGIEAIVADCGGACACATCHVYIDDAWLSRIPPRDDMEADMLDFVAAPIDHRSRLSCQIIIQGEYDGLVVHTPETQG